MERTKNWSSLEEREDYRENNYWEREGLPYNPKKFVRKIEVERIINATAFEMKDDLDEDVCKILYKYIDSIKEQIDCLETLYGEIERRKRELD